MTKHFDRDLTRVFEKISDLGKLVIDANDKSIAMLENFDLVLADEIFDAERQINEMEVEIEEECLKVLALHQPVAADLRFLITVLKVNNDLERMGDHLSLIHISEPTRPY